MIESKPNIVFGGLSKDFVHAGKTEDFMAKKNINDKDNFKKAFKYLSDELIPDNNPTLASPEYRKYLSQALLYKVKV